MIPTGLTHLGTFRRMQAMGELIGVFDAQPRDTPEFNAVFEQVFGLDSSTG